MKEAKALLKKKRIIALISALIVVALVSFLTYFLVVRFSKIASSGTEFKNYIQGFGTYGFLVAVGIQILQVILAFIPGEFVEIGIGYAYGWIVGTVLCIIGISAGSSMIFLLVKKYGIRFIELFVSANRINELRIINSEKKLKTTTFILYLIPGTPKDLITYFVGLTRMTLKQFLSITLVARIPSIVTSTLGGNLVGNGKYIHAIVLFVVTACVSLLGVKLYRILLSKAKKRLENAKLKKHSG